MFFTVILELYYAVDPSERLHKTVDIPYSPQSDANVCFCLRLILLCVFIMFAYFF